jgi:hypothetical protein|tara:strand:- start:2167 stop:2319 length:153 start_codon:yes stop_codon:yes gene_type:complete
MHRLHGVPIQKTNKATTKMKVLQSSDANLMGAFYQMQGGTKSNLDFIGYQ